MERPNEEQSPPGGLTPSEDKEIDDAYELRSEILRSRLIQLYLAKISVPTPCNEADECSSMRVEDDESDYNDRRTLFSDTFSETEARSCRSPAVRSRKDLTVSPASTCGEDEAEDEGDGLELPVILPPRALADRRLSLDPALINSCDVLGQKKASNRLLEVQRIARYLQSDRRASVDSPRRRTESILAGGDLAVSKDQMKWLEADLHTARVAAWRSELGLRYQISRRGSLQDDPSLAAFRMAKQRSLRPPSLHEPVQPSGLAPAAAPALSASPQTAGTPTAPKSPLRRGKSDLQRREMNVYAPVSF